MLHLQADGDIAKLQSEALSDHISKVPRVEPFCEVGFLAGSPSDDCVPVRKE